MGGQEARSRRFLGLPKTKKKRIGPKTYAGNFLGGREARSLSFLGLVMTKKGKIWPKNLRERESRGRKFTPA